MSASTRVIERADVARASLYSTFGSKDELIRSYLEHRMKISQARLRAAAGAQPGSAAYEVPRAYRRWFRDFLRDLAAAAEAPDPGLLASQIHLLYDGAWPTRAAVGTGSRSRPSPPAPAEAGQIAVRPPSAASDERTFSPCAS